MRTSVGLAPVASDDDCPYLHPDFIADCQGFGGYSTSTGAAPSKKDNSHIPLSPYSQSPYLYQAQKHAGLDLNYVCALENIHPTQLLQTIQQLVHFEAYYYPPGEISNFHNGAYHVEQRDEAAALLHGIHGAYYQFPDQVLVSALYLFQRYLLWVSVPVRCFKLVLSCCYYIAAEHWLLECSDGSTTDMPSRDDLLRLLGCSSHNLRDWDDWESSLRNYMCPPHPCMPLVTSTALDFLNLFAIGYGITRDMIQLLTMCLTQSSLACSYSPRVLAMSVFYASVPMEQWDSLHYAQELAQLCAIPSMEFVECSQIVMQVARYKARPSTHRVNNLLHDWRSRSGLVAGSKRASPFMLDFTICTIKEESL
jgi:hypothetical protein